MRADVGAAAADPSRPSVDKRKGRVLARRSTRVAHGEPRAQEPRQNAAAHTTSSGSIMFGRPSEIGNTWPDSTQRSDPSTTCTSKRMWCSARRNASSVFSASSSASGSVTPTARAASRNDGHSSVGSRWTRNSRSNADSSRTSTLVASRLSRPSSTSLRLQRRVLIVCRRTIAEVVGGAAGDGAATPPRDGDEEWSRASAKPRAAATLAARAHSSRSWATRAASAAATRQSRGKGTGLSTAPQCKVHQTTE
mmetsp:Transcript_25367/g.76393  ORF Transcript_25367/g.76393 Transcript_25367/m.76393 type:complete len:251 (-) Transcript_25367:222-974(-)